MSWKDYGYEISITEDGSPTLRSYKADLTPEERPPETMHHRGGAFSETQEIYGIPLKEALAEGLSSALSVGLGLGYNEILFATESLKRGLKAKDLLLVSYESEAVLRDCFLMFLNSELKDPEILKTYEDVLSLFLRDTELKSETTVKSFLLEMKTLGAWKLKESLGPENLPEHKFHCIFYDAFSSKTSPELWDEEFLTRLWNKNAAGTCWITTYACTGNLKRSLKAAGFEVILRQGFKSKRNSTLGKRRG